MAARLYTFRLTEMEARVAGDALAAALAGPTDDTSDFGWSDAENNAAIRAERKLSISETPEFAKQVLSEIHQLKRSE
jgi:hypothetical protein